jgi:SHS2 domain-containing protein
MLNVSAVEPKKEELIKVNGHDEKELLYEWLEALLLKFDIDGMVYSQFEISSISAKSNPLTLQAKVKGEKYDRRKHGVKEEIKGITYHLMQIDKTPKRVTVRFVLDL